MPDTLPVRATPSAPPPAPPSVREPIYAKVIKPKPGALNGAAVILADRSEGGLAAARPRPASAANGAGRTISGQVRLADREAGHGGPSLGKLQQMVSALPAQVARKDAAQLHGQDTRGVERLLLDHHPELGGELPVKSRAQRQHWRRVLKRTWDKAVAKFQDGFRQRHEAFAEKRRAGPAPARRAPAGERLMRDHDVARSAAKVAALPDFKALHEEIRSAVSLDGMASARADGLHQVADYSGRLDRDMARMQVLAQKLTAGALPDKEAMELNHLLHFHRDALASAQTWLGDRTATLQDTAAGAAEASLLRGMAERLADRHMELADLVAVASNHLPSREAVPAVERTYSAMMHALGVANGLESLLKEYDLPPGASAAVAPIAADVRTHAETLRALHRAQSGRGDGVDHLAALVDLPVTADAAKAPAARAALGEHWRAHALGRTDKPLLPDSMEGLTQRGMLDHFVRFRLAEAGVAAESLPDLEFLWNRGHNASVNAGDWRVVGGTVTMETGAEAAPRTGSYTSTITPAGVALEAHLGRPYPSAGVGSADRMQVDHVPNLARTELRDSGGRVLFQGWRHGILDPYMISAQSLRKMPRGQVAELLEKSFGADYLGRMNRGPVADIAEYVQTAMPVKDLDRLAEAMRRRGADRMAEDLAIAYLSTHDEARAAALAGDVVEIPAINSISLVTPDLVRSDEGAEVSMLAHQTAAFRRLESREEPATVLLRGEEGQIHPVQVRFSRVRTFNFGVNHFAVDKVARISAGAPIMRRVVGWGISAKLNDPALTDFLGPAREAWPGGAVGEHLAAQNEKLAALDALRGQMLPVVQAKMRRVDSLHAEKQEALQGFEQRQQALEQSAVPPRHDALIKDHAALSGGLAQKQAAYERAQSGPALREFAEDTALGTLERPGTLAPDDGIIEEPKPGAVSEYGARALEIFAQAHDWASTRAPAEVAVELERLAQPPPGEIADARGERLTRIEGLHWFRDKIAPARAALEADRANLRSLDQQLEAQIARSRELLPAQEEAMLRGLQQLDAEKAAALAAHEQKRAVELGSFDAELRGLTEAHAAEGGTSGLRTINDVFRAKAEVLAHADLVTEVSGQIKQIWKSGNYRVGSHEPYKMVSRLALLSQLVEQETLFNCKSGKDRTGQLDAEVKMKAAEADLTGTLAPPDQAPTLQKRRNATEFALGTGNLEMQSMSAALPGFKLWGVPGLQNQMLPGARALYRGGSDSVAA